MAKIFISYSRNDQKIVKELADDLELRQADVWWDQNLGSGQRFKDELIRQISELDNFLLIHSKPSRLSDWVALETAVAMARVANNKPDFLQLISADEWAIPRTGLYPAR